MQAKNNIKDLHKIQKNCLSNSNDLQDDLNDIESGDACSQSKRFQEKDKKQNTVKGKWTQEQDKIYMQFLVQNRNKITSKSCRKNEKIYRQLSQALGHSRTPKQCRMHHLRMKRTTRSINTIVNFLGKKHNKLIIQKQKNKDSQLLVPTDVTPLKPVQGNQGKNKEIKITIDATQISVTQIRNSEVLIHLCLDLSSVKVW